MTIPGPPPKGVSSTVRCLSRAKSRMSTVSSTHLPSDSACPASECASGPGNISGNSVMARAVHGTVSVTSSLHRSTRRGLRHRLRRRRSVGAGVRSRLLDQARYRRDHELPARQIHHRHRLAGEGDHVRTRTGARRSRSPLRRRSHGRRGPGQVRGVPGPAAHPHWRGRRSNRSGRRDSIPPRRVPEARPLETNSFSPFSASAAVRSAIPSIRATIRPLT